MTSRQLQSQPGMARLNGSNRAAWNAMDLDIGAQIPSSNARGIGGGEDCGALSARNVLLRQKLRERKRYDSADDAMKKAAARATTRYQTTELSGSTEIPVEGMSSSLVPNQIRQQPFSPAQMGQAVFFNAMDSNLSTQNIHHQVSTSVYEPLPRRLAVEGRNEMIQRKFHSKLTFDCRSPHLIEEAQDGHENIGQMKDRSMKDMKEVDYTNEDAVSSPCASVAVSSSRRQQFTSMSPSSAGKYGALENKKKPSRRELLEQQQQQQKNTLCMSNIADGKAQPIGGSDYGKLSAAHVLIRRKLKERKRFDSADYAMEKQGKSMDVPADIAANPATPGTAASRYSTLGMSQAAINHQVKHIKLSESPSRRAMSSGVGNAAQAALAARAARYTGLKKMNTMGADNNSSQTARDRYDFNKHSAPSSAAAARSLLLQHKLAERKMFDSADHFKEAA